MVAAILAGLRVADKTGAGPVVDVSLFATAAWTMASDLAPTLVDGAPVTKRDRHHLITPLGNRFRCADDRWIILNMPEVRWWAPFCKTIERPEILDDARFVTVKDRFDNMAALIDIIDDAMATRTLAEWGRIFDDAGLIWGPASSIDELARDPQAEAIGLFPTIEHPEGAFRTVAAPMRITGADIRPAARHRRSAVTPSPCSPRSATSSDEAAALERGGRRRSLIRSQNNVGGAISVGTGNGSRAATTARTCSWNRRASTEGSTLSGVWTKTWPAALGQPAGHDGDPRLPAGDRGHSRRDRDTHDRLVRERLGSTGSRGLLPHVSRSASLVGGRRTGGRVEHDLLDALVGEDPLQRRPGDRAVEEPRVADLDGEPVAGRQRREPADERRQGAEVGGPNEPGAGPRASRPAHRAVRASRNARTSSSAPRSRRSWVIVRGSLNRKRKPAGHLLGPRLDGRRRRHAVERRVALDGVAPRGVGGELVGAGQAAPGAGGPATTCTPTSRNRPAAPSSPTLGRIVPRGGRSQVASSAANAALRLPCRRMPLSAREQAEIVAANAVRHGSRSCSCTGCGCSPAAGIRGGSCSTNGATHAVAVDWPDDPPNRWRRRGAPRGLRRQDGRPGRRPRRRRHRQLRRASRSSSATPSAGLMAQIVAGRGRTAGAVAIDPAPFRGVLPLPFSSLKASFPVLGNPLQPVEGGDADPRAVPVRVLQRGPRGGGRGSSGRRTACRRPAVPLFQAAFANVNRRTECQVDTRAGRPRPLLIISGEKDHIVPWRLANAAKKRYKVGCRRRSSRSPAGATRCASTAAGARSPRRR